MSARVRRCVICKCPTVGDPTALVVDGRAYHLTCAQERIDEQISAMSDEDWAAIVRADNEYSVKLDRDSE